MITLNSVMGALGPIVIARAIGLLETNPTTVTMGLVAAGVALVGASAWVFNYIRQMLSARVTAGHAVFGLAPHLPAPHPTKTA